MSTATCPPCTGNCNQGRDCPAPAHLHRMLLGDVPTPVPVAIATQRDGTLRLLPTSSKPLAAEIDYSDSAEEGGQFREPAPVRVPRHRSLFKTDAEMFCDGWEPATRKETLLVLGVPSLLLAIALAVWVWWAV